MQKKFQWVCLITRALNNSTCTMTNSVFHTNTVHWRRTPSSDCKAVLRHFHWTLVLNFMYFHFTEPDFLFSSHKRKINLQMEATAQKWLITPHPHKNNYLYTPSFFPFKQPEITFFKQLIKLHSKYSTEETRRRRSWLSRETFSNSMPSKFNSSLQPFGF